jgi:hypothetical protein
LLDVDDFVSIASRHLREFLRSETPALSLTRLEDLASDRYSFQINLLDS